MNTKEVHKLNDEEIKVETLRLRRRLFDLRSQAVTEKIEDTSQSGKARKDLARVLTEANRRRREKSPVAAGGGGRSKKRSGHGDGGADRNDGRRSRCEDGHHQPRRRRRNP
ncbi:MAG: 50S ribosomal protein L29 [Phycisphaerales bacterium]